MYDRCFETSYLCDQTAYFISVKTNKNGLYFDGPLFTVWDTGY